MSNIKLSVLIPSTHNRYNTFRPKIERQLYEQYNSLSIFDQSQIEIIVLSDTKSIMLGHKRNIMCEMAQGEYIVFVDDDDIISNDYLYSLFEATKTGADSIVFHSEVTINGIDSKICKYSKDYGRDYNTATEYHRIPNHICCIKRELSLKISFPSIKYGEDSAYSKLLLPHLKTEHKIDRVLYHYLFNEQTTETQEHLTPVLRRRKQPAVVDIIILSKALTPQMHKMTQTAIDTAISGANSLPVNVIVIEQNRRATYTNAQTIHNSNQIHYNKWMNHGAEQGKSEWVMFCNNDLIFESGWLHQLLIANHPIMSPKCPKDYRQVDVLENEIGDKCGRNLSGWAIFMKRSLWLNIGKLPEVVSFWFSDNSTIKEVNKLGISPMLVPSSIVRHLGSVTSRTTDSRTMTDLTWLQCKIYNDYYNDNLFEDNQQYKNWKLKNKL